MSSDFEFQGKTVEKAVQAACKKLEIKEENLNYDILTQGRTGLFGLVGVKKARISVITQENQMGRESRPLSASGQNESPAGGEKV